MLHAILKGKIRGLFDNIKDGMSWREAYSTYEDFLTASVVGRMTYLPEDVLWKILKTSSVHSLLPRNVGSIDQIDFWPNWAVPPWMQENSQYREPDVFIKFEQVDIIIEAKRNDSFTQNYKQWIEQILSYLYKRDTEGDEKKPIIYWVLGGMGDAISQENINSELAKLIPFIHEKYPQENIALAASSWGNLLTCLLDLQHFLTEEIHRKSSLIVSNERQHILRITNDIIEALRLHGIKEWHFLTETTQYWAEDKFSKKSFKYFNISNVVSTKNIINDELCWDKLHNTENQFDDAIKWYGG